MAVKLESRVDDAAAENHAVPVKDGALAGGGGTHRLREGNVAFSVVAAGDRLGGAADLDQIFPGEIGRAHV